MRALLLSRCLGTDAISLTSYLCRLCYPSADHTISSLEEARTALKTLQKYDIPYIPDSILLLLTLETSAHPTAVYAIACGYNLTSIANQAARASLRKPLLHDTISREDFALMSSYHYDLLLRYHTRCCAAASETAVSFHWMKDIYESSLFIKRKGCTCPTTHRDFRGPSARVSLPALNWVIEFMRECAEELKVTPCWDGVMGRGRAMMRGSVAAMKRECGPCMEAVEKLPAFAEDIGRQVELAISQVRFYVGLYKLEHLMS